MKQTKSLLTLFLTAALAVANIAPSWGGVSPVITYADGVYQIQSYYNNTAKGYILVNNLSSTGLTEDNLQQSYLTLTRQGETSNYQITGKVGADTYYFGKDEGSATATKPAWSTTPRTIEIFEDGLPDAYKGNGYVYFSMNNTAESGGSFFADGTKKRLVGLSDAGVLNTAATITGSMSTTNAKKITFKLLPVNWYFDISAEVGTDMGGYGTASVSDAKTSILMKNATDTKGKQTVTFTAEPADNCEFIGWFTSADCTGDPISTSDSYAYTVYSSSHDKDEPEEIILYAGFKPSAVSKPIVSANITIPDAMLVDEELEDVFNISGCSNNNVPTRNTGDFYYTITNSYAAESDQEVIAYNPANNTVTAQRAGTAELKFYDINSDAEDKLVASFSFTVQKRDFTYTWNWSSLFENTANNNPLTTTCTDATITITNTIPNSNVTYNASAKTATVAYMSHAQQTTTFEVAVAGDHKYNALNETQTCYVGKNPNHVDIAVDNSTFGQRTWLAMNPVATSTPAGFEPYFENGNIIFPKKYQAIRDIVLSFEGVPNQLSFDYINLNVPSPYPYNFTLTITWKTATGVTIGDPIVVQEECDGLNLRHFSTIVPINARKVELNYSGVEASMSISNLQISELAGVRVNPERINFVETGTSQEMVNVEYANLAQGSNISVSANHCDVVDVIEIGSNHGMDVAGQYELTVLKPSQNDKIKFSASTIKENNPSSANVVVTVSEFQVSYNHNTVGGTFTVNGREDISMTTSEDGEIALVATPAAGYTFYRFYTIDDNVKTTIGEPLQPSLNYEFTEAATVSAEFVANEEAIFYTNGKVCASLSEAITASAYGSTILQLRDYTVPAGNYTIPAGVTLLVPNKEDQTTPVGMNVRLLMPEKSGSTWISPAILNDKYAYRTLTLAGGANITVNGAIEVTGDQYAEAGVLHQLNGIVAGPYGQIVLNSGSKITLNSNSTLRAWGYITGAGTIDAKDGSIVREFFQIADWRGGDVVLDMLADKKAFPTTQYYIQNIESAVTYYTGAQLITKACVFIPTFEMLVAADDIIIIGIEGTGSPMFYMQPLSDANTWVRKSYDAIKDRQVYTLNSSASLGSMHINIHATGLVADMNSKDFVLPITNNMDIILNDGTMNITQSTVLLPGATIQNAKTSTIIVQKTSKSSTGSNIPCALYLTDVDEYEALGIGSSTQKNRFILPVFYSPSWTNGCPRADAQYDKTKLADAELFIHGSLDLEGSLYTTDGGANIHSTSADAGTIRFYNDAAVGSTLYQKTATYKENTVTAAQLRNDNGTTVSTEGTKSNQSYNFYNGAWRCWETQDCLEIDKTDQSNWVYYAKPQDYVALTSGTEDENHLYYSVEGSRTLIQTLDAGSNCQWWEVTKVPNEDYYYCATNGIYYYYDETAEMWLEKTANVKFVNSDGTLLKEYEDAIIGTTVTLPDNPSHPTDPSNYDFAGWSPEPGVITKDITFTAQYTQRGVTIEDKELVTNEVWDVPVGKVVADLTLNASADASCQIKNVQNLIVKGNVYLDYTFNAAAFTQAGQEWYAFGVPFQVNANTGMSLALGTEMDIIYYDGATRAQKGVDKSAWKFLDAQPAANRILRPGVLYLAAFRYATETVHFIKDPNAQLDNTEGVASVSSYASLTSDDRDRGWNGIANPALFYANLDAGVTTGQVYQNGNNSYLAVDMTSKSFVMGAPVFVQVDKTQSIVVNSAAAAAPIRKLMTNTSSNYSVALSQDGKLTDRVIVAADDYATDEYTIGQDLAKAGVSTKVAQMWVDRYDAQLCKNTVAADDDMAEYPLAIFAPKAGEYTIALEQIPTDGVLFLTENGSITWNLNIAPATLDLSKGTDTTYGLRLVRKSGDVVTGNNEVILNGDVQKVIINDRLYILRDGKVYSAHGHVIK